MAEVAKADEGPRRAKVSKMAKKFDTGVKIGRRSKRMRWDPFFKEAPG
jgi:hypothetical protein